MTVDVDARLGAQKQWNARAYGELPGEKQSVAYFEAVAANRYRSGTGCRITSALSGFLERTFSKLELDGEPT